MPILCLGLNHTTAPLDLREQLAYSPPALKAALARMGCGRASAGLPVSELAVLSTCNRLEVYAAAPDGIPAPAVFAALQDFLAETRGLPPEQFAPHLYRFAGPQAVRHLCRVAAGLDSLLLGEPQILGQVAEALEVARGQGAAGPILTALFRAAIHAGKRARTETGISRNSSSAGSVAARLAGEILGDLGAARALVLGAGEMGKIAAEALWARGVRSIAVASRTRARAAELAGRWQGEAVVYEELPAALAAADIVIAASGAPHLLVSAGLAREALSRRSKFPLAGPERPLLFIDLAVPRDVDPDVRHLPGAVLYDLDQLHEQLGESLAGRQAAVPLVEAIIAAEVEAFAEWQRRLAIAPVIRDLRCRADTICRGEVEKTLRYLPELTDSERAHIQALASAVAKKLLHEPTLRLKAEAGNGHAAEYAAAVRHLFALNG